MIHLQSVSLRDIIRNPMPKQLKRSKNCKVYDIEYKVTLPDVIILLVKCNEKYSNDTGWLVTLRFDGYVPSKRDTVKPISADMRLKCSCPAFQYWGSAYIATLNDYNLDFAENRFPGIRDPLLENYACKHVVKSYFALKNKTFKQLMKKYAKHDSSYEERLKMTKRLKSSISYDGVASDDDVKSALEKLGIPMFSKDTFDMDVVSNIGDF